jgi:hypothetical protein
MIYSGQAVIDYLASEVTKEDPGESSHWRKFHSTFRFKGDGFEGLQGFGGCAKPYRGLRYMGHRFLQRRYRLIGSEFPEFDKIDKLGEEITTCEGRAYDLDVLRQVLTLSFLSYCLPNALSMQATGCVIGDGFASMTSLLLASRSAGRVVLINLTKTLLVDLYYIKLWMGAAAFESRVDLVTDEGGLQRALALSIDIDTGGGRVVAIQASHHELLKECPVDFAFNIVSMQEMDLPVVMAYFDDLRAVAVKREVFFYCCNREEKVLPDGTRTCFSEYPWHEDDKILVDELCPWHQFYYVLRPPFYRPYDGLIRHRLVTLHKVGLNEEKLKQ